MGPLWQGVPSGPGIAGVLPPRNEVEAVYGAAAAEPPLMNEDPRFAAVFADVYDVSVRNGQVLMTLTRTQPDGRLSSFAYGHHWKRGRTEISVGIRTAEPPRRGFDRTRIDLRSQPARP